MENRLSIYAPQALALLRIVTALLFVHAGMVLLFQVPASTHPLPPPEMKPILLVAGILELAGGALVLVGLFTRAAAFILSGMMAVAYWGFHAPMNMWPANNMGSAAILFSFIYLYLVFAGAGAWSLDARRVRATGP
jgi:putative oxidoreductase